MSHVTLSDIARVVGTSVGSVSRALNGQSGLSIDLRQRVLAVAKELGRIEPPPRSSTGTSTAQHLLFLLNRYHGGALRNPFYSRVLHGAELAARALNISFSLLTLSLGDDVPRLVDNYKPTQLLSVGYMEPMLLQELHQTGLPLLLLDHQMDGLPCLNEDNFAGAMLATQHLMARGHKRIAFLGGSQEHASVFMRFKGYRTALYERSYLADPGLEAHLHIQPQHHDEAIGKVMQTWLQRPAPPDAVFAFNDATALGVIRWAQRHGVRIPEDLALMGYDDIAEAEAAGLSTIRVDKESLGSMAVAQLMELAHSPLKARTSFLPVTLVQRASTLGHGRLSET